jgi:lysozyme
MRKVLPSIVELIKDFEKFSPTSYICAGGAKTIGYGHVILANEQIPQQIDEDFAHELLNRDILISQTSVLRNINVPLSDNQFGALVSFTFNVGGAALQRSTLKQQLNRYEYLLVPVELNKWVFAGAKKLPGLIKRRRIEAELFSR